MVPAFARLRRWIAAAFGMGAVYIGAPAACAGEVRLVVVEQVGCQFCIAWDREIAPIYSKTPQGRFAPLQRAKRGDRKLSNFNPVIYTPTFLVVRNGEEVGRVTGYSGEIFFWEQLDEELVKAGYRPNWGIPELGKSSGTNWQRAPSPAPVLSWKTSHAEH